MGNKEMENKRKKNVCVVFVPPLPWAQEKKGEKFVFILSHLHFSLN